jgi:signal transduction histidine kinase/ActR/RegA family two-component response regulator
MPQTSGRGDGWISPVIETALSSAGVGLYERDLASNAVTLSRSLAAALDLPEQTTLEDVITRVHPDDLRQAQAAVARAVREGGDFLVEARTMLGGGQYLLHQWRGCVLRDDAGNAQRVLSVAITLTGRQSAAQRQHVRRMDALTHLVGGVAHDFNNLLTAILGYARFLQPTLSDHEQQRDLDEIVKAGERAVSLTQQLLRFSRPVELPDQIAIDLNGIVAAAVRSLRRLMPARIVVTERFAPHLPAIAADPAQLEQTIGNLLLSGADTLNGGGRILVTTAAVDRDGVPCVELTIAAGASGGQSAPSAESRPDDAVTGPDGGLGLVSALAAATRSRGAFSVDATARGGSRFALTLPVVAPPQSGAAPGTSPLARGSESILLVEDERPVRYLARTILERTGYRVAEASDVAEAIRLAATDTFDLLVTDVLLGGGNGPDLFRTLKAGSPALRVLYMSGYAEASGLDVTRLDRDAAFIAKPFTFESFAAAVRDVLDRADRS